MDHLMYKMFELLLLYNCAVALLKPSMCTIDHVLNPCFIDGNDPKVRLVWI